MTKLLHLLLAMAAIMVNQVVFRFIFCKKKTITIVFSNICSYFLNILDRI